jgi:hypothetical protein
VEDAFEEGQGSCRAVTPMMMMMISSVEVERCLLPSSGRPGDGSKYLWNIGKFIQDCTAQCPRTLSS